jgi:hypothetical protein
MSAWKVSQASTLPNQVFRAFTSTDSGSTSVTLLMAARSVNGTPRKRSMTSILQRNAFAADILAIQMVSAQPTGLL